MQLRVMRLAEVPRMAQRIIVANVSRGFVSLSARQPKLSGHPGWEAWTVDVDVPVEVVVEEDGER